MAYSDTFFTDVSDEEIYNIAIEQFEVIAPEICRMKNKKGQEYYSIDGFQYGKDKKLERKILNLGYFAPIKFDIYGNTMVDTEEILNNLKACKSFILFMAAKNGKEYENEVKNLFEYIKREIDKIEEEKHA